MASELKPPKIKYAGVAVAANGPVGWRFTTGTRPSSTVLTVHKSQWEQKLKAKLGEDADLEITDSRGVTITIKRLTLMQIQPSGSPNRVAFVVSDLRWRWQYPLISRDYNVPKKTGDRTALLNVPQKGFLTEDLYDFKSFSLIDAERVWTAQEALEDVLEQLREETKSFRYIIKSFPIDETYSGGQRQFTLQNVVLRDQGDVALSRLMSYIPGATLWVDAQGVVKIINGADLKATEDYFDGLPVATYDGEKAVIVERRKLRPRKIVVHYQREVELLLEYADDYSGGTQTQPVFKRPYIENVIQTVDDETTVTEYDPIARKNITKEKVPPGTWVEFKAWLTAMDKDRPPNSDPWTFETLKMHWIKGDLDGALGAGGKDLDEDANISMRIQAIKQHFRQSFRINRLLVDRTRDFINLRVGLLDPVTGTRAPSSVWGQACIIPSKKGEMMARGRKKSPKEGFLFYRNVDYLAPSKNAKKNRIIETSPGPTKVSMIDRDLGIFRLDWIVSPYGTEQSFVPCLVENEGTQQPGSPTRDMGLQDTNPIGPGVKVEGATNSIFLNSTLEYKIMLSIVPGAPNNKNTFHREEITAADVEKFTEGDWRIGNGEGPTLEVFIPPTEATARFAHKRDSQAAETIGKLLGLDKKDPLDAGIEGNDLDGFALENHQREIWSHSRAVASELYAAFADSLQGRITTVFRPNGFDVVGNTSAVTLAAAAAPSGKVTAMHEFPGVQKPISRMALMSESARQVMLGIVRFRGES